MESPKPTSDIVFTDPSAVVTVHDNLETDEACG
jgi:hypothetical protein